LNEEDRAERAEYDAQVAEAWPLHNKYNSNPAEEDAGSELLVLASSLFNGMEGIEMGGASEVQGTEIGSASEVQGNVGSNSTAFGGDGEVKVTRYGRVLRKKTK
jgi:hypothetical protein